MFRTCQYVLVCKLFGRIYVFNAKVFIVRRCGMFSSKQERGSVRILSMFVIGITGIGVRGGAKG